MPTATLIGKPQVFERGDKVFLTTPLTLVTPTDAQVDEYAFASAVKTKAPNENLGWVQGRYVEAGRPNLNGAMWLSDELALKSLTPMLMPVTVMHDPRTAVGTIADCKFVEESASARIDTILAVWRHRFPDIWEETVANMQNGQMMQSMETYAPWYTCSSCETAYVKLPGGAERASWCDHLRANDSWRILRDVCFTGTGLIFGSRGGIGAYTEAHLADFQDEIADYHERSHQDGSYRPTQTGARGNMALVQIEDSELATLRRERDDAKRTATEEQAKVATLEGEKRELTTKVETAEAAKVKSDGEKTAAEKKVTDLTESAQAAQLKDTRLAALGTGFMGKLGETSKKVLTELAAKSSDAEWDDALKEREELAGVKRDAAGAGTPPGPGTPPASSATSGFADEEVARAFSGVGANGGGTGPAVQDGATSVRQLGRMFANKGKPVPAGKS